MIDFFKPQRLHAGCNIALVNPLGALITRGEIKRNNFYEKKIMPFLPNVSKVTELIQCTCICILCVNFVASRQQQSLGPSRKGGAFLRFVHVSGSPSPSRSLCSDFSNSAFDSAPGVTWSIGSMGCIGGADRTFACKSQECPW